MIQITEAAISIYLSSIQIFSEWFSLPVYMLCPGKICAWIPSNNSTGIATSTISYTEWASSLAFNSLNRICLVLDFPKLPVVRGYSWYMLFSFSDPSYFWPMPQIECWAKKTLCLMLTSCFYSDQNEGSAIYGVLILRLNI